MPYINVRITREPKATTQQKAEIVRRITDVVTEVLQKNPATTIVTIDEVDDENWGIAGLTVAERKATGNY